MVIKEFSVAWTLWKPCLQRLALGTNKLQGIKRRGGPAGWHSLRIVESGGQKVHLKIFHRQKVPSSEASHSVVRPSARPRLRGTPPVYACVVTKEGGIEQGSPMKTYVLLPERTIEGRLLFFVRDYTRRWHRARFPMRSYVLLPDHTMDGRSPLQRRSSLQKAPSSKVSRL